MIYTGENLIKAYFIKEDKTRFSCTINFKNDIIKCYVPSTCKLKKLIDTAPTEALITKNHYQKNISPYSLFALKVKGEYIIVNSGFANKIVKEVLMSNNNDILSEYYVGEYKSDFFISSKSRIIEVKSIVSDKGTIVLPNIASKRAIIQLEHILSLLTEGYKVDYYFVLFAPFLKKCIIDEKNEYGRLLQECVNKGMNIKAYYTSITKEFIINSQICNKNLIVFSDK